MGSWGVVEWSGVVAAFAAAVTAVVAMVAARFAFAQVREARRLREDQAKPFVVVDIQPSHASIHILDVVVENIGATMAREVHIAFTPEVETTIQGYDLKSTVAIRDGIPMIPPGRRLVFLFDQTVDRKGADLPMRYDVVVNYQDKDGRPQEPLEFPIDLSPLYGMRVVENKGLHHAAKSLDELVRITERWTGIGGRLQVRTTSAHRERTDEDAEYALTGEYPSLGRRRPPEILLWLLRFTPLRILWGWLRERLQRQ